MERLGITAGVGMERHRAKCRVGLVGVEGLGGKGGLYRFVNKDIIAF